MATLVKDIETVKKYATVNFNTNFNVLQPHIRQAERKHLKPAISKEQLQNLAAGNNTGKKLEVQELLEEASVNLALLRYSKTAIISIGNNGLLITTAANAKPAEWWQVRDLQRELYKSGTDAIDEALEIMEENTADFQEWQQSSSYTKFKELFTHTTASFQNWYNINNSRITFLQLRPHIKRTEDKYFKALLGQDTITQIKEASSDEEKEALKICQAAQTMLTIAEVADEGLFLLTKNGLMLMTDEVQGESKQGISTQEREHLKFKKQQDGNEYLKQLVKLLNTHPQTFTHFANKQKNEAIKTTYNKKSLLSI